MEIVTSLFASVPGVITLGLAGFVWATGGILAHRLFGRHGK